MRKLTLAVLLAATTAIALAATVGATAALLLGDFKRLNRR
jgi:hypothetical protein